MARISLVKAAHDFIKLSLKAGAIAIDATVGNGHDTVFLLQQVAPKGHVYGFDIQQDAIDVTQEKCRQQQLSPYVTLFCVSHADMASKIPAQWHGVIDAIMFNLGYLPKGNKQFITQVQSTLTALDSASRLLSANGVMTIVAYPGHAGGDMETEAVKQWLKDLPAGCFDVQCVDSDEANPEAPKLFLLKRLFLLETMRDSENCL